MDHLHELGTRLSFDVYLERIKKGDVKNPPVLPRFDRHYEPVKRIPVPNERSSRCDEIDSLRRG